MARPDPFAFLDADDPRHVDRPDGLPSELAGYLTRGLDPVLVVGHPGTGRSTVLAHAHAALAAEGWALRVDLGALEVALDPGRVLFDLAREALAWWAQEGPEAEPSPFLVQDARASDPVFPQGQGRTLKPRELMEAVLDELNGAAGLERIPLLLDGLDSVPVPVGRRVLTALLPVRSRAAVAVAASPALAHGPESRAALDRYRVLSVDPLDPSREADRAFLTAVARAHLGAVLKEDLEVDQVLPAAALEALVDGSGGVLRDLVGLVGDAFGHAGSDVIGEDAAGRALDDRAERCRRLMVDGDREALLRADGTDGLEVPAARKPRLLEQGLLLERGRTGSARVQVHPLARRILHGSPVEPADAPG